MSAVFTARADVVRANNATIQIGIDQTTGQLTEFVDLASNHNFVGSARDIGGLWELEFDGDIVSPLLPTDAQKCEAERLPDTTPGLRLTWSDFRLPRWANLRVEVTVLLDGQQPISRWGIAIGGAGSPPLARLWFPRILHLTPLDHEALAMPAWTGLLARNPRQAFARHSTGSGRRAYAYPGHCSMQCLAFYSEGGPGLYLSSDDNAGYHKTFAAFSEAEGQLNLELSHLPERSASPPDYYVLPYCVLVGTFRGDWFDAAIKYRSWATNQVWARQSRLKRGQVPPWVGQTGMWVWNRGRSTNVLDPAIALQGQLGLPVSVFWHWWHGCAYDTGFPEYLPPREGTQPFKTAVARAHDRHVRSLVYMNQRLWGMTTPSWTNENAARYAVKNISGQIQPEVYNQFATNQPCASMCLGTQFWRTKYATLAARARNELGVDGIYMDQACSSLACYDPRHGHPLGGGTYWMNGFRRLAADLRARCALGGGVTLAGEGCAENWLPYLDLMLALELSRERYTTPDGWEPIPFFHAVYHDYALFYGNYSSLTLPPYDDLWPTNTAPKEPLKLLDRKFSRQFFLEQARAFVWGQQPTIANFQPSHLRERPEEITYALRLARLRARALKYLRDGVMLRPPAVEVPEEEIPISRLSIYAGQIEPIKEFVEKVPLVLASAWRTRDGLVAIVVASIADQPLTPKISLESVDKRLPANARFHVLGHSDAKSGLQLKATGGILSPTLGPLDALIMEWDGRVVGSN